MQKKGAKASIPVIGVVLLTSCGGQAPALPPEDSMALDLPSFLSNDTSGALTARSVTATHVAVAAASVVGVTVAVNLALVVPRAAFAGTVVVQPEENNGLWTWNKLFPLLGLETTLEAEAQDGDAVEVRMYVDGTGANTQQFDHFLWFDGTHRPTAGTWRFYDNSTQAPVVKVAWALSSATDRTLSFSNVTNGLPASGDSIVYALAGTDASMEIHDARDNNGDSVDFAVHWDTETGAGSLSRNAESLCWDTAMNQHADIPCP